MLDGSPPLGENPATLSDRYHESPSRDLKLYGEGVWSWRPPEISVELGGSGVVVSGLGEGGSGGNGGKRGVISCFSRQSRHRLMRMVGRVRRDCVPLFVTLTYWQEWGESRDWKRHLANFWAALQRAYPGSSAVWKLERQGRGAPHFHLLVWTPGRFLPCDWLSRVWARVTGDESWQHLAAGVEVTAVRSFNGAWHYASKYVAKVDEAGELVKATERRFGEGTVSDRLRSQWAAVGRWWGILGREFLPWARMRLLTLRRGGDEASIVLDALRALRDLYRVRRGKLPHASDTILSSVFSEPDDWVLYLRVAARSRGEALVARGELRPSQVEGWVSLVVGRLAFPG